MHRPSSFVCTPAHRGCPLLLMAVVSQGGECSWVAGACHRHDDRAHSVRASSDWILVPADEGSGPIRARLAIKGSVNEIVIFSIGNSLGCNEQPSAEEDMTFSLTVPFILLFGAISRESLL